ncbi:DUF2878 domain-containing protein [Vibrio tubiashii]|uniref:Zinc ABC transporter permease n=1 Tax=Vibrio tubiashii ATCC 19109 TaxID=1051646 RepID=F9TA34_9VIBR|nr:DUF2878 domain-containing protein [Vibrio tubiashii]AIW13731.1 zinc ABC transporter permease [Vibrio tubiashii ATCC 19109]EGU50448.1 hypothetical protein VITU9109_16298 [Vibrio tubiashii ATCC 19109]EIF01881.1 hypothetical protein VT1337_21967 [Vibrio tubiashii NCIMB 1337 = ATCC 19106]
MKRLLIVSTWFQVIWFCAVIGNYDLQYATLSLVVLTLAISAVKENLSWFKYALIVVIGVLVDFTNLTIGWFQFQHEYFPVWLFALWLIFAWYTHFLYPILSQYPLAIVSMVGGIGGALSYVAGESLGAVSFGASTFTIVGILLVEWTLIIALIMKVYGHEVHNSNNSVPSADR